jgi:hypothetical protein
MIRESIKKVIKEKGISVRRCAIDNNVDYSNFVGFLNGKRTFPLCKIERVLEYLELKIKDK